MVVFNSFFSPLSFSRFIQIPWAHWRLWWAGQRRPSCHPFPCGRRKSQGTPWEVWLQFLPQWKNFTGSFHSGLSSHQVSSDSIAQRSWLYSVNACLWHYLLLFVTSREAFISWVSSVINKWSFPGGSVVMNLPARADVGTTPVGKIPWRKKWQPRPVSYLEMLWTEEPAGLKSMESQRAGHN